MSAAEGTQFFVDVMDATDKVFRNMCDSISFEEVYRRVYYLVLHKHGHTLQRTLEAKFQEYAGKVLCHQRFHSSARKVVDLFLYMGRNYVCLGRRGLHCKDGRAHFLGEGPSTGGVRWSTCEESLRLWAGAQ